METELRGRVREVCLRFTLCLFAFCLCQQQAKAMTMIRRRLMAVVTARAVVDVAPALSLLSFSALSLSPPLLLASHFRPAPFKCTAKILMIRDNDAQCRWQRLESFALPLAFSIAVSLSLPHFTLLLSLPCLGVIDFDCTSAWAWHNCAYFIFSWPF